MPAGLCTFLLRVSITHVCPGRPVPAINDMAGAFRTAPGDTLERNVVRGTGDRTTHVILGESGQPGEEA
jgi:hypothetical protein